MDWKPAQLEVKSRRRGTNLASEGSLSIHGALYRLLELREAGGFIGDIIVVKSLILGSLGYLATDDQLQGLILPTYQKLFIQFQPVGCQGSFDTAV